MVKTAQDEAAVGWRRSLCDQNMSGLSACWCWYWPTMNSSVLAATTLWWGPLCVWSRYRMGGGVGCGAVVHAWGSAYDNRDSRLEIMTKNSYWNKQSLSLWLFLNHYISSLINIASHTNYVSDTYPIIIWSVLPYQDNNTRVSITKLPCHRK